MTTESVSLQSHVSFYLFFQFKQLMMLVDPNDDEEEEDEKNKTAGGGTPPPTAEEYNDPEHPGYADPNAEITTYAPEEADALAATMQPTVREYLHTLNRTNHALYFVINYLAALTVFLLVYTYFCLKFL